MHGLDISFKGLPVVTYCLKKQINVGTTLRVKILFLRKNLEIKNPWPENSKSKQRKQPILNDKMAQTGKKNLEWLNCYQPNHIRKNCKNPTVGWIDNFQNFKEEHNFSDELYKNWIKIFSLN